MRQPASWPCVWLLVCAAGCRSVTAPDGGLPSGRQPGGAAASLREQKPEPLTIPVELMFVRYEEHDAALHDELWRLIDEQAIDDALRRRLAANGLRLGVLAGDLPPHVAERILPERAAPSALGDGLAADTALSHRRLRLLPGRRSEIIAATGITELVLLEAHEGRVRGGTFHDAKSMLELRVRPAADGRVHVDLVPEIRHGPVERSWVGEDGMFRIEAGQKRHRREDLAVGVDVAAGGLLVLGCAGGQGATLGDALLRDQGVGRGTMRLLAIRPGGRGVDAMFVEAPAAGAEDGDEPLEVR